MNGANVCELSFVAPATVNTISWQLMLHKSRKLVVNVHHIWSCYTVETTQSRVTIGLGNYTLTANIRIYYFTHPPPDVHSLSPFYLTANDRTRTQGRKSRGTGVTSPQNM